MMSPARSTIIAASLLGFTGVGLGAFGAHALKDTLVVNGTTATWQTAVLYQLIHAVALLALPGGPWVSRCWIVGVGFIAPDVTKTLPSTTQRLSSPCALPKPSTTDESGSSPARAVPRIWKPAARLSGLTMTSTAPAARSASLARAMPNSSSRRLFSPTR